MTPYVIFRIIVFVLAGVVVYIVDRRFGPRFYRWWYGMTHEFPLPAGVVRGTVYGQPTKVRAGMATALASVIALVALRFAHANALVELLLWVAGILLVFAGFLLGPAVRRLWARKDTVFDAVDQIESGDMDIEEKLRAESGRVRGFLRSLFGRRAKAPSPAAPEDPKRVTQKDEAEIEVPDEEKAREMVERFVNREKDGDA